MKKGWQTKRLGDVTTKIGSGATPRGGDESYKTEGISLIRSLSVYDDGFREAKLAHIDDEQADDLSNVVVEPHDVLLNITGASVARCCRAPADFLPARVNQHVSIIRPVKQKLDSDFLHYLLISKIYKDRLLHTGEEGGSTRQAITKAQLQEFVVEFPDSLAEQRRIVGVLDEAFEGLATAKANAEKNLQNARALFKSHLQSVFTQRGPGWVEKRLEEVCGLQNGFAFKSSTFKPSGAPILRISNIQDGCIDAGNRLVFFDPKDYRENLDRYRIVEDDLLIAMSGATTGKLGFNTESTVYYLNQRVGKFEPSEKLNKRFLYHFLSTKVDENLRISAGAAQPNLSTEQIKGFVLPLPSVDEQERIVEALETLSEQTHHLARPYEQKLAALGALKKSLLHQAFSGEL